MTMLFKKAIHKAMSLMQNKRHTDFRLADAKASGMPNRIHNADETC